MADDRRYFRDIPQKRDIQPGDHAPVDAGAGTADGTFVEGSQTQPGFVQLATDADITAAAANRVVAAKELLARLTAIMEQLPTVDALNPKLEGYVPTVVQGLIRWRLPTGGTGGGGGLNQEQVTQIFTALIQAGGYTTTTATNSAISTAIANLKTVNDVTFDAVTNMLSINHNDDRGITTIDLSHLAGGGSGNPTFTARLASGSNDLTLTVGTTTHVVALDKYVNNNATGLVINPALTVRLTGAPDYELIIPTLTSDGTVGDVRVSLAALAGGGGTGAAQVLSGARDPISTDGAANNLWINTTNLTLWFRESTTWAQLPSGGGGSTGDAFVELDPFEPVTGDFNFSGITSGNTVTGSIGTQEFPDGRATAKLANGHFFVNGRGAFYSTDGTLVSAGSRSSLRYVFDAAFGAGVYVAVGSIDSNPTPGIFRGTTPQLSSGTAGPTTGDSYLTGIAFGDNQFVAVGTKDLNLALTFAPSTAAADANVYTSPDGITWTEQTPTGLGHALFRIKFLAGKWWGLGRATDSSANNLYTSTDGIAWTLVPDSANTGNIVQFGTRLYRWGDGSFISADNGATWTTPTEAFPGNSIGVFGNILYAYGNNASSEQDLIYSSTDGETWSAREYASGVAGSFAGFGYESVGTDDVFIQAYASTANVPGFRVFYFERIPVQGDVASGGGNGGGGDGTDQTARDAAAAAQTTANAAFTDATIESTTLTLKRTVGDDVVLTLPSSGGGGAESTDDFTGATLENNIVTLTRRSGNDPVELDLTDYVNRTAAEIATALFTTSSRSFTPDARTTFNIPGGGIQLGVLQLGAITDAEATAANGGETVRVTVAPLWKETSESGFPAQVTATILLNRPGRNPATIQESSVHLRGSQTASVAFNLPTSGNQNGDTLQVNFSGQDNGNGSEGTIEIASATISVQGTGTAPVIALATDAANQVVSPLRNDVAAVETRSFNNQTNITANTTKNAEQDREITALQQRTPFTPSEAALDLLRRALEVHMDGDPTYTGRIRSVVRWQVGATPPTTLDDEGVTVSTPQRRTISGLGTQNDKIYYVKTNSFNSDAGGHLIYRVTASGGDEPIFGTVVNSAGTRVWQAISTDPLDPNIFQIITTATLTAGIPYQTGDTIGWAFETFENGHARVVPVIIRADGTTSVQGNDVNFNSDNAATNFDPDKIAIVTGNHISDVWVAKLDGLGARHSEIAAADPREAGLGFRVAGAGRDILTLSGDIEWTGNSFIVKEGAFKIRKADGTTEVFTAGGEIPTETINQAIATYLADNPISPTQATVVQRDYNQTTLATAAAASLNGNTGLWVVANQQSGTQGIPTANVSAGTGVTLPTAVNGIVNLPAGTMCRIRSGTDILVMFIPGTSGTAQTGLEIVALLEGLSGNARLAATAIDGLANVATSGSYNDLSDTPSIPTNLNDLSDVNAGSPANGQTIVWNGTAWVAQTPAGGGATTVAELNDIGDVGITSPTVNQVLTWNGTAWVNQTPTGTTPTQNDPEHIRAAWFGGGDPRLARYSVPAATILTGNPGSVASVQTGALPSGYSLDTTGFSLKNGAVLRWTNGDIDYSAIKSIVEMNVESAANTQLNFFFGMNGWADGGFENRSSGVNTGIAITFAGDGGVSIYRADTSQALTAAGVWGTATSRVRAHGSGNLTLGEHRIEIVWFKSRVIIRDNGEEVFDVFLPSVPTLTGDNFGVFAWGGGPSSATSLKIQGISIEDVTSEDIDPQVPASAGAESINDLSDVDTSTNEPKNDDVLTWDGTNWIPSAPPSGGGGTNTDSYWIDAWIRTPKGSTVPSVPFTSPGTWNNNKSAPAFTSKPTENIASGTVFDISDLPANAASTTAFDYHHFQRIFTVGETNVPNNAWKYVGLYTHSQADPSTYLIHAYLRLTGTDTPTSTSLTSAGTWNDATKSFSTEPTHGTLGDVFDQSNLPSDAFSSTTHGYWEYERYFTVGETGVAASAWTLKGRINPAPATGGGLPSGFVALPFLTYELRGASSTEPSTAAYTISGATLPAEFQALSALRQRDFFLTFNFGEGTQTPKEWVALAPFSVSMEGVAASGSRSFGFRVPGPASQVDGARVTITLDANNKITSIAFQATSGGQGQEMQLTRPAGVYGDTGSTF